MKIQTADQIGVCSWSLQVKDMGELVAKMKELGLEHVQLGMAGVLELDEKRRKTEMDQLVRAGIGITAGMISFAGEDYATIGAIRDTGGYVPADQNAADIIDGLFHAQGTADNLAWERLIRRTKRR